MAELLGLVVGFGLSLTVAQDASSNRTIRAAKVLMESCVRL